uniref:Uncharacterized protein n=1 Tax=Oryza glumipatula TaxID=40148 RepID=A0A0D9Y3Q9_9ORYZ
MAAAKKEKEEEEEASKLQLKPAGSKVFSKLLSRESAAAAPSFRVYYGVASAGTVPFLWESQPGTPKNAMSDAVLPPLTPPPSYYTAGKDGASNKVSAGGGGGRKYGKHGILRLFVLPKIRLRRGGRPASGSPTSSCASSTSSSSSSASFYSSYSLSFRSTQSPTCSSMRSLQGHGGGRAFGDDDDEDDDDDMAAATACFRVRHESFRAIKNCRVAMTVRSAISSAAGGGGASAAVAPKAA